jgi:hypothetical protein
MLRRLQRHPLLVGGVEMIVNAMRYLAIMLVVVMLLGQAAGLAF